MRLTQQIDLGEGRKLVLRELRVADVHNAIGKAGALDGFDLKAMADPARLAELLGWLGDCVELSGCQVEDLAFSELNAAFDTFREVNAAFFGMLALAGINLPAATGGESLNAPAASSSNADTGASLTTAGASS